MASQLKIAALISVLKKTDFKNLLQDTTNFRVFLLKTRRFFLFPMLNTTFGTKNKDFIRFFQLFFIKFGGFLLLNHSDFFYYFH